MGHFSAIKWATFRLTNTIKPTRSARSVSLRVRPNPTIGQLFQSNNKVKNILALADIVSKTISTT
jgi:hypothetical protein